MRTVGLVACAFALILSATCAQCHRLQSLSHVCNALRHGVRQNVPPADDGPWFCHGMECPLFTVETTTPAYEVRKYAPGAWAYTEVDDPNFTLALAKGSAKLFQYLGGHNSEQRLINRTVPVVVRFQPTLGYRTSEPNYTVAFFIPSALTANPPVPTDPTISIALTKPSTTYVASFGGYALGSKILSVAAALDSALKTNGIDFDSNYFVYNTYDPPTRFTGRHNEVQFKGTS